MNSQCLYWTKPKTITHQWDCFMLLSISILITRLNIQLTRQVYLLLCHNFFVISFFSYIFSFAFYYLLTAGAVIFSIMRSHTFCEWVIFWEKNYIFVQTDNKILIIFLWKKQNHWLACVFVLRKSISGYNI